MNERLMEMLAIGARPHGRSQNSYDKRWGPGRIVSILRVAVPSLFRALYSLRGYSPVVKGRLIAHKDGTTIGNSCADPRTDFDSVPSCLRR
jgi:hypothetical protein